MRPGRPQPMRRVPQSASPHQMPDGRNISLMSIQEEVRLPMNRNIIEARSVRVWRLEEPPSISDQDARLDSRPVQKRFERQEPVAERPCDEAKQQRAPVAPPHRERAALREVGQIARDEAGNMYEVRGRHVRRLGELVRDEQGRVFELGEACETAEAGSRKDNSPQAVSNEVAPENPIRKYASKIDPATSSQKTGRPQIVREPPYRKILEEPGILVTMIFGQIKSEIGPRLAHPEKLADGDAIDCYVQIYETRHTMSAASIAACELGDPSLQTQFRPLTSDRAKLLGVPQLYRPSRQPFESEASNRPLYPGQRVYHLRPVFDPTAAPDLDSVTSSKRVPALRTEIPEQYVSAAQFRYSREEVLYDMKGPLGTLTPEAGALARWLLFYPPRLMNVVATALVGLGRMKKWRAMLQGKTPEEQLWAVTPPRGFSHRPAARRWAEMMLVNEGYDPRILIIEWEIFWRRKGWK
jgi:hypothetical protein